MAKTDAFENIRIEATSGNDVYAPKNFDADELSLSEQKRQRYYQNTKYRRYFSVWVMIIVPSWLVLVLALLALCAFSVAALSDTVLVTLLATTTANILGLAFIVLKGMFPQAKE